MAPPMTMPATISGYDTMPGEARVVPIAITMPAMPNMLPERDVTGDDRPRSARMKQTDATR